jgi:hypothetical protein
MAPKGSPKQKKKATARATMSTLGKNQRLLLDWNHIQRSIPEHIHGVIWIYIVPHIKAEMAWDLFNDIIFLDPVTTCHFLQFHQIWPHRSCSWSPFRKWLVALCLFMGQMFNKTSDHMSNWRWDNPCASGYQVNHSNPQTTSSGKNECTRAHFS